MQSKIDGSIVWISVVALAAAFMAMLDLSITHVALNEIRGSFAVPLDQIGWVTTSYAMAHLTIIPLTAWLSKRFGIRPYFLVSLSVFTFASALCGISWSLGSLIAFRVLQGLSGGALVPLAQNILFSRYPQSKYAAVGALLSVCLNSAPLLAPTIGGYLVDAADWHCVFLINVPLGIGTIAAAWVYLRESDFVPLRARVDVVGILLLAISSIAVVYVLEEGNRELWFESRRVLAATLVGTIATVVFVVHELETPNPLLDFRALREANLAVCVMLYAFTGIVSVGGTFLFSLLCGAVLHYAALDIGLLTLKATAIQLPVVFLAAHIVPRVDARIMIGAGLVGLSLSMYWSGQLNAEPDQWALGFPQFLRAVSMGVIGVPLTVTSFVGVGQKRRGNAAAFINIGRTLGSSLSVAVLGSVIARRVQINQGALAPNLSPENPVFHDQMRAMVKRLATAAVPDAEKAALVLLQHRVEKQALARSFSQTFAELAVFIAVGLVFVPLLRPAGRPGRTVLQTFHVIAGRMRALRKT